MQNILLKGGYLIDGTGAAIKRKDLLIKNGYINEIAENIPFQGDVTCLDVRGMHITPGFIDIHSHADWDIFALPGCTNKLMQGVTTEVINNCGLSSFPISETYREDLLDYLHTQSVALPEKITWNSLDGYREVITKKGHGSNLLALVGHGSLRIAIVGLNDKKLNNKELQAMQTLLEKLLQEGAAGLSMGLVYPPSAYADQEEMLVLAKVLKKYNAVLSCHLRDEGDFLLEALEEMLDIAEKTGVNLQISHLKALGKRNFGKALQALERIKAAQKLGIKVFADQYPFSASNTTLSVILPTQSLSNGVEGFLEKLKDKSEFANIEKSVAAEIAKRGGGDKIMIGSIYKPEYKSFIGKTIADYSKFYQLSEAQGAIKLLQEERCGVSAVFHSISNNEMQELLRSEVIAVCSDAGSSDLTDEGKRYVHPRYYAAFTKPLLSNDTLAIEKAVYKMTGLPATILQRKDCGFLKENLRADINIFSMEKINAKSSYAHPYNYSKGLIYQLINGMFSVYDGRLINEECGSFLNGNN